MDRGGEMYKRLFATEQLRSSLINQETPESERFRQEYKALVEDLWKQRNTRLRAINQDYAREQLAQRRLASSLALLSPAAAYGFLVSDAAGTGDLAYEQYLNDVTDYHALLDRTVLAQLRDSQVKVRIEGGALWMNVGERPDWTEVPEFTTTPNNLAKVMQTRVWAFVSLLVYLVLPFLIAYVAFLRYDVR